MTSLVCAVPCDCCQHPALLSVGCYDGTVKVFDVRKKENTHIFMSDIRTGKHTDPVWQVRWQAEDLANDKSFFSVSSDGRVASWAMSKNELKMEPVMMLKLTSTQKDVPDEESSLTGVCLSQMASCVAVRAVCRVACLVRYFDH